MNIEDLEDDAPKKDEDSLKRITHMAERIKRGQMFLERLENRVKRYKKALNNLETIQLPDAMLEVGMKEFKLMGDEKIMIKDIVVASISVKNKEAAFSWLEEAGHGDLIKNEVKLKFGKGEDDLAERVFKGLVDEGFNPSQTRSVHPQTLSAFAREQMDQGESIPEDIITLYIGRKAIIK